MGTQQDFFSAIESGHADQVRGLLSADPQLVNVKNEAGLSAVLLATYHGRNEIAKLLIDRGARLDIFEAAATGTQERVEQLLHKEPGSLNSYSADGWTPLHLAVFFGRINIVHLLLNKGRRSTRPRRTISGSRRSTQPWPIRRTQPWRSFSSTAELILMPGNQKASRLSITPRQMVWS